MIGPDSLSLPIPVLAEFLNLFKSFNVVSLTNTKKVFLCVYIYVCMYIVTHTNTSYVCICYTILRTEEPGGLQSVGPQRVRHSECNDDGTLYILYIIYIYVYYYIYMERERGIWLKRLIK